MIIGNALDLFQLILPDGGAVLFSAPDWNSAIGLAQSLLPHSSANKPICVQKMETLLPD